MQLLKRTADGTETREKATHHRDMGRTRVRVQVALGQSVSHPTAMKTKVGARFFPSFAQEARRTGSGSGTTVW